VFEADPPTTTLQRLKALVTGGFPTFVDFSWNFHSDRLDEDNILRQFCLRNLSTLRMGDDTWLNLFPDSVSRAFPYPAFNVKDLHTVDNGVLAHRMPEVRQGEYDLLIAHFLGVDHIGHRYRADHPSMKPKIHRSILPLKMSFAILTMTQFCSYSEIME
jgi:phosphatidylinositol glycan class O